MKTTCSYSIGCLKYVGAWSLSLLIGLAWCAQAWAVEFGSDAEEMPHDVSMAGISMTGTGGDGVLPKVNPGGISIEDRWTWSTTGSSIRLTVDKLINRRSSTSGTLRLELWALPAPYGSGAPGYKIAERVLGQLQAGYYYSFLDYTVARLTTPPNGSWYVYMFATEYTGAGTNQGFSVADWEPMTPNWVIGSALPDLVISYIFIPVVSAQAGSTIGATVATIRNQGGATAQAGARLKYYWSTNTTISTGDTYSGWYCDTPAALAPGASYTCNGSVGAPATAGLYYFGAIVNEAGAIQESSYDNNTNYDTVPVIVSGGTVTPTGMVVEYYNPDLNNFFITSDPAEQSYVDSGAVGRWLRTGNAFRAGGPSDACRFYGNSAFNPATSRSYGPNSHFYTADPGECAYLMSIFNQNARSWRFESYDFKTTRATSGTCTGGLVPIYRAYNNGYARGIDSNHRITNSYNGYLQSLAAGWSGEGVVMCAPPGGTVAQ